MPPRWSEEMTVKFVKLYVEHDCLWDRLNGLYKNKLARQSALSDVASKMNIDGFDSTEANRKIKALRATYYSEMAKVVSSERCGHVHAPTLKWFYDMKRIMHTPPLNRKPISAAQVALKPAAHLKRHIEPREDGDGGAPTDFGIIGALRDSASEAGKERPDPPDGGPKRFRPRPEVRQTTATAGPDQHGRLHTTSKPDAEFDIFGQHVASQLRRLQVEHAVVAMGEISHVLAQKRLVSLALLGTNALQRPPEHVTWPTHIGTVSPDGLQRANENNDISVRH